MTPMPWMTRPCAPSPIVSPSSISEGIEPTCADCESKSGEMPGGFPGSHASRHVECTYYFVDIWEKRGRHIWGKGVLGIQKRTKEFDS